MENPPRISRLSIKEKDVLTCKPLKSYVDLLIFTQRLPSWRSLCEHFKPHSKFKVKNMDYAGIVPDLIKLEDPFPFCHITNEHEIDVRRELGSNLPKTMVCHDMANGYHDDCHIDGTNNFEAYTFYHWPAIDIFCYFSHNLITIPPLSWINVGHLHGVKVIGTLITEWKDGVTFWEQMLATEEEWRNLASMLVAVAKMLKFDGWLLNIENKVDSPDSLLRFVRFLHSLLHAELRNPVLIWYDSVTMQGKLHWQNALNKKNKPFFDVCDGIFTNYSWNPDDVESSADMAGPRRHDVYIGIDVWGRNFFGGGMFNTQEAIAVAHNFGCSISIFAPAWTYEALSSEGDTTPIAMADEMPMYDKFLLRDRALWDSMWPFLNINLPCSLPFVTYFCRGQGKKRWLYGELVEDEPWYNLRFMQYQPNSNHGPHGYVLSTAEKIAHAAKDRTGNGILRLRQSFIETNRLRMQELAETDRLKELDLDDDTRSIRSELQVASASEVCVGPMIPAKKPSLTTRFVRFVKRKFSSKKKQPDTPQCSAPSIPSEPDIDLSRSGLKLGSTASTRKTLLTENASVNLHLGERTRLRYELGYIKGESGCLQPFWGDAFLGGSCLIVTPGEARFRTPRGAAVRLFHCDLPIDPAVVICVVTKTLPEFPDQYLQVNLVMRDDKNFRTSVTLLGDYKAALPSPSARVCHAVNSDNNLTAFQELQNYLMTSEPGFYVSVENAFGWKVRYFVVERPGNQITSINLRAGNDMNPILLGYIGICRKGPPIPQRAPSISTSVTSSQFKDSTMSVKL